MFPPLRPLYELHAMSSSPASPQVRRSIEDLLHLVKTYPRENHDVVLEDSELLLFQRHYSNMMYQAILTCTQKSLQAMKRRLGSKVRRLAILHPCSIDALSCMGCALPFKAYLLKALT